MEIVGNGFLATHLRAAFGARYPRVIAVAAGVTKTTTTDPADFDREAELVYSLLRRCRAEHRQLLFFSTASFAMYGSTEPAVEWGPVYPPVAYGRHKLALEACVRASGADYLILRLSHVVGQHRQPHQMLPAIVEQVLNGSVTIYRGAQRDLLDADDFCYAIDRMLGAGVTDMVVNVASGVSQPIERIVDGVERRLGSTAERLYVPGHGWRAQPCIDRLLALVPQFRRERIHAGYLDQILDAYLPHVVALTHKAALSTVAALR